METRIAVTPSEENTCSTQSLSQCYSGLLYLLESRDPETRRSVFAIRGDAPMSAMQALKQQVESRGAIFEILEPSSDEYEGSVWL